MSADRGGRLRERRHAGRCWSATTSMLCLADHPRGPSADRAREPGRPVRRRRDRPAAGPQHPRADRRGEGRDARRDPRTREILERTEALTGGAAVDAVGLPVGTRVKLRPRAGGDVFDLALAGKTAVVEVVETDMEGHVFVGVLVDDDPGRDLGERGHRFFFSPARRSRRCGVLGRRDRQRVPRRRRLRRRAGRAARRAPPGVEVVDFGIRGMDLAYALRRLRRRGVPRRDAARRARPGRCT